MSDRRVNRGGSWSYAPAFARVAGRYRNTPSIRFDYLGFRLVEEVEEAEEAEEVMHRGGSWNNDPRYARVASRFRGSPDVRGNYLGLRLVEETSNITNGE